MTFAWLFIDFCFLQRMTCHANYMRKYINLTCPETIKSGRELLCVDRSNTSTWEEESMSIEAVRLCAWPHSNQEEEPAGSPSQPQLLHLPPRCDGHLHQSNQSATGQCGRSINSLSSKPNRCTISFLPTKGRSTSTDSRKNGAQGLQGSNLLFLWKEGSH